MHTIIYITIFTVLINQLKFTVMKTTTKLEEQVLLAVLFSDYQDGEYEERVNNPVWYLEESDVSMKPGQLSGAISSCLKKGYIGIDKAGKDSTIWITQKGYDAIEHLLEDTFVKKFFQEKITDKIKSYEDACELLGIDPDCLPDVDYCQAEDRASIIAYYKLTIIARALNEGWNPDWSNHYQCKYYGYLYIDTAGFVYAHTKYTASGAIASIGSRLCFKTHELALYAIEKFKSLYEEYLFIK